MIIHLFNRYTSAQLRHQKFTSQSATRESCEFLMITTDGLLWYSLLNYGVAHGGRCLHNTASRSDETRNETLRPPTIP